MVTAGDDFSDSQQFFDTGSAQTSSGGGVFTVDHSELGTELPFQFRQHFCDGGSAAFAYNISQKNQIHDSDLTISMQLRKSMYIIYTLMGFNSI
jgi:hypothetical protein